MKTLKILMTAAIIAIPFFSACKEDPKKEEPAAQETPAQNNTQVETNAAGSGEIALNPAHGQPNHRCDIPVGAPLNSSPSNTNTQQSPLMNNGSSPATGKLNPPHGQPGHRCDIKVGDPL